MVDIRSFPSCDDITRSLRAREMRAADALRTLYPEFDDSRAWPLEVIEAVAARYGVTVVGYRHPDDTWVQELPLGQFAVELYHNSKIGTTLGHGPAFAAYYHPVRGAGQRRRLGRLLRRIPSTHE